MAANLTLSLGVRCLCGIAWNCVKLIYDCLSYGLFDSFFFSHRHFLLRVFFVTLPVLDAFAKKFIRFSGVCRSCVCAVCDYVFFIFYRIFATNSIEPYLFWGTWRSWQMGICRIETALGFGPGACCMRHSGRITVRRTMVMTFNDNRHSIAFFCVIRSSSSTLHKHTHMQYTIR